MSRVPRPSRSRAPPTRRSTTVEAINFSIKASAELKLEGSASAELKGGGMAKVTGAMVQIN